MTEQPPLPGLEGWGLSSRTLARVAAAVAEFTVCWCGCYRGNHDDRGVCGECGCETYAAANAPEPPVTAPMMRLMGRATVTLQPEGRYL